MQSSAKTVKDYLIEIPEERQVPFEKLRQTILKNLPKGFSEEMSYGMIGYVVPHSIYPAGYHCDPKLPLPFLALANQKNFIGFYHSGLYADPKLTKWFQEEYAKQCKYKLDMGKSCVRLKRMDDIPFDLIAQLCKKFTPEQWIELYEKALKQ